MTDSAARRLPWVSALIHGAFGGTVIAIDLSMVMETWRATAFGVLIGLYASWGVIRGAMEVRNA